jgi:Protein of unknown function (DUF3108)
VIAAFRTPARRIALAIALSLTIHAVILWLPYIQLPQTDVRLPTLSVRLEPLPKPVEKVAVETKLAKPEQGHPLTQSGASAKPETSAMATMEKSEETNEPQPFPKHLQLSYTVYKGKDGFRTGEIVQQLDIHGDRYNLKSVRTTSGLASLHNSDQLIQTSRGRIVEQGLQPEIFEQQSITGSGKQSLRVTFDRTKNELHYSHGGEDALPANAQDILSYMYQLSQLQMREEFFQLPVDDGTKLRQYEIEIGTREDITTPMGNLHTLRLRKMHTAGEAYFEIWLGLGYRLLPVKFSEVDSSGNVIEEIDISGIRAADE